MTSFGVGEGVEDCIDGGAELTGGGIEVVTPVFEGFDACVHVMP